MTSTKRLPAILVTTGIFSWILVAIGFLHEKVWDSSFHAYSNYFTFFASITSFHALFGLKKLRYKESVSLFHQTHFVIFLLYACLCCWQYYSWISIKCRQGQQVLITATVFLITTIGFLITSSLTLTSETKDVTEATQRKVRLQSWKLKIFVLNMNADISLRTKSGVNIMNHVHQKWRIFPHQAI